MKVMTVIGARPQFIKSAPVSRALAREGAVEFRLHTGQHYDESMSEVFFRELDIPAPDVNLNVGSGPHGWQTGEMLKGIERALMDAKPDWVIVYGDTNSTLAGALAACKLQIPLVHVEAGLRSFNRRMPEEYNRVLTDHCSQLLFCPTSTAVANLNREGITEGVVLTGDVMYDAVVQFAEKAESCSTILEDLRLDNKKYLLATIHRAGNTDAMERLQGIVQGLMDIGEPVIFPVHPRTRAKIAQLPPQLLNRLKKSLLRAIPPLGYIDMLMLEKHARLILTDSGGVQKEAFFQGVPCVIFREETEWVELISHGHSVLAGTRASDILSACQNIDATAAIPNDNLFGDGNAAPAMIFEMKKRAGCHNISD